MTTSATQVATAVYYNSDKAFPSTAIPSTGEDTYKRVAQEINKNVERSPHEDQRSSDYVSIAVLNAIIVILNRFVSVDRDLHRQITDNQM